MSEKFIIEGFSGEEDQIRENTIKELKISFGESIIDSILTALQAGEALSELLNGRLGNKSSPKHQIIHKLEVNEYVPMQSIIESMELVFKSNAYTELVVRRLNDRFVSFDLFKGSQLIGLLTIEHLARIRQVEITISFDPNPIPHPTKNDRKDSWLQWLGQQFSKTLPVRASNY